MNPIETAVSPLKGEAIIRAEQDARALVERVLATIAEQGGDLRAAYPDPNSLRDGKAQYIAKQRRRNLARSLTDIDTSKPTDYRMSAPVWVVPSQEKIERFVELSKESAAAQYDAFVTKLVAKVGDCDNATLTGNHVWGHSILKVVKGTTIERWKTQQIVNQSVLGTLFNQWPTRKVKGAA